VAGSVLLDTNIVIGLFANDQPILARLSQTDHIFIPSTVLGELYYGACKSGHSERNVRRIDEFAGAVAVLVCDAGTAVHYGRIKKALREKGKPLPENDIWIPPVAQQHGLTVISRDRHFREIETLSVEAWQWWSAKE
jgi:tRNA(fMet)-specific endonuclease VapC